MDRSSFSPISQWSGRGCLAAGIVVLAWTLVIYPIAFEYASRELRANVAGGSRLALISEGFPRMASGWFAVCLVASSALALSSLYLVQSTRRWRGVQIGVLTTSITFLVLHIVVDGPAYVAQNCWKAVTHPDSFRWPVYYFSTA